MNVPTMPLPKRGMLLLALLQGLAFLLLHHAMALSFWPHQSPQWLFAFYTAAFVFPTMVLLSVTRHNVVRVLLFSAACTLVASLLGFYVGYQVVPLSTMSYGTLLFVFVVTMAIAGFKALMYAQQWSSGEAISYSALFKWSWRNFLTFGLALAFAGGAFLVFILWGQLFKAIGIHFFNDLFTEQWFYYPALTLAQGVGIIIFRNLSNVIDTITRLQQAMMKFLLVAVVLVSILFLGALPFTGLSTLWDSGGSGLILWMQALILFFVNGVYQDDTRVRPYAIWLHRFIYSGVVLLPIYSLIAVYGLTLRIEQYGWSISRCWALLIWFVFAVFSLGYCWGIVKLRDHWIEQLSRVNVVAGLLVLALMLLVNSPLLDFRKIVVESHLKRLAANTVSLDDFDIHYFRWHLARPGYDALEVLKKEHSDNAQWLLRVNSLYGEDEGHSLTQAEFTAALEVIGETPPASLITAVFEAESQDTWDTRNILAYHIAPVELNRGGALEYVLIKQKKYGTHLTLYYLKDSEWKTLPVSTNKTLRADDSAALLESLRDSGLSVEPPEWDQFFIDGRSFKVN